MEEERAAAGREPATSPAGFTLVELLTVVLILGVLSAIALSTFLRQTERARDAQAGSDARNLVTATLTLESGPSLDFAVLTAAGFQPSDSATMDHAVCVLPGWFGVAVHHTSSGNVVLWDQDSGTLQPVATGALATPDVEGGLRSLDPGCVGAAVSVRP